MRRVRSHFMGWVKRNVWWKWCKNRQTTRVVILSTRIIRNHYKRERCRRLTHTFLTPFSFPWPFLHNISRGSEKKSVCDCDFLIISEFWSEFRVCVIKVEIKWFLREILRLDHWISKRAIICEFFVFIGKQSFWEKKKTAKMSIHGHDEDIDVVSSPEPSPRHSSESQERLTSTPIQSRSPAFDRTANERASVSPAKTESSDQGKTNAAFTSFSINSILSRSETKRDELINTPFLPNAPLTDPNSLQDAAMISRWVLFFFSFKITNETGLEKKKKSGKKDMW